MKKYEVWIILEEWEKGNKLRNVRHSQVGATEDKEGAEQLFNLVNDLGSVAKPFLEPTVRFVD